MLLLKNQQDETIGELAKERISIGRDHANNVVSADDSVSEFHAVILNDGRVVSIGDLGSTNGTAVDGRRLRERAQLKAWCTLEIGNTHLEVTDAEVQRSTELGPVALFQLDIRLGRDAPSFHHRGIHTTADHSVSVYVLPSRNSVGRWGGEPAWGSESYARNHLWAMM